MLGFIFTNKLEFDQFGFIPSNHNAKLFEIYECENLNYPYKYIISGEGNINSAVCTQKLIDEECSTIIHLAGCYGQCNENKLDNIYNISKVVTDNLNDISRENLKFVKYNGNNIKNNTIIYSSDSNIQVPNNLKSVKLSDSESLGISNVCKINNKQLLILKAIVNDEELVVTENLVIGAMQNLSVAIYEKLELIMRVDYETYDKPKIEIDNLYGMISPSFQPVTDFNYNKSMGSIRDKLR